VKPQVNPHVVECSRTEHTFFAGLITRRSRVQIPPLQPQRPSTEGLLIGYHLEQAYRFRQSLGSLGDDEISLARRASQWLGSAGRSALSRRDVPAAVGLLDRTVALEPNHAQRARCQLDLVDALQESGSLQRAHALVDEVADWAKRVRDRALLSRALLRRFMLPQLQTRPDPPLEEVEREAQRAIALFGTTGDERALAEA
jgi:hypothetical protein